MINLAVIKKFYLYLHIEKDVRSRTLKIIARILKCVKVKTLHSQNLLKNTNDLQYLLGQNGFV